MDEYVGLPDAHPQSFRSYLRRHFLDHIEPACFHPIRGEASSASAEAERYAALLAEAPVDVIGLGIGENGHVAFNDPPVADFSDPVLAKMVELDDASRKQQVTMAAFRTCLWFPGWRLRSRCGYSPKPAASAASCPASGRQGGKGCGLGSVGPACPATILRTHPRAELFLDREAASLLLPIPSDEPDSAIASRGPSTDETRILAHHHRIIWRHFRR